MPLLLAGPPQALLLPRPHAAPSRLSRAAPRHIRAPRLRAVESSGPDFNLADFFEAKVEDVAQTGQGHVILLRVLAAQGGALQMPIYIGAFESEALNQELHRNHQLLARPATHDLMKNSLLALGFRVSRVAITALRDNTYLGSVTFALGRDKRDPKFKEVVLDARPSDAINLAVRFNSPVYVNKEVARKMGSLKHFPDRYETHAEIRKSCRLQMRRYQDPTCVLKLQLQVAIAEERYDDAARLRDDIERAMANNRLLSLLVAMDTALEDSRFEEAAKLRDEFRHLQDKVTQGLAGV